MSPRPADFFARRHGLRECGEILDVRKDDGDFLSMALRSSRAAEPKFQGYKSGSQVGIVFMYTPGLCHTCYFVVFKVA